MHYLSNGPSTHDIGVGKYISRLERFAMNAVVVVVVDIIYYGTPPQGVLAL